MPDPAQPIERKLAAIFAADVAGYSRLMGQDEVGTLRRLSNYREIMDRLIGEHRGRIANTAGDSVLAEFPSVVEAVKCAVEVQKAIAEANGGVPDDRRMSFRIGVLARWRSRGTALCSPQEPRSRQRSCRQEPDPATVVQAR